MKYQGKIQDPLDLVTKQYVDNRSGVKSVNGNTGDVTVTYQSLSDKPTIYSQNKIISSNYTLLPEDIGKTIMIYNVPSGTTSITISLPDTTEAQGMPAGAEFAVYLHSSGVTVNITRTNSNVYIGCSEWGGYYTGSTRTLKMTKRLSMVAIRKVFRTDPYWLVTGEYETP